jgi:hypothetical protein
VDVTASLPAACQDPPWILLWPLPVVGDFHTDDQTQGRFIAVDVDDLVLVIVLESYAAGDIDQLLEAGMAAVASTRIGAAAAMPSGPAMSAVPS